MGTHYEAVAIGDLRTKVMDVFLGAYGEKLRTETKADCCTIAAQEHHLDVLDRRVSAVN